MNDSPLLSCDARQLGHSLRLWRSMRRLKQGAVAAALRVSQTTVSRWEYGRTMRSRRSLLGWRSRKPLSSIQ